MMKLTEENKVIARLKIKKPSGQFCPVCACVALGRLAVAAAGCFVLTLFPGKKPKDAHPQAAEEVQHHVQLRTQHTLQETQQTPPKIGPATTQWTLSFVCRMLERR